MAERVIDEGKIELTKQYQRYVEVYQLDSEMEVLLGNDRLDGGDVLPGFTMTMADVFDGV